MWKQVLIYGFSGGGHAGSAVARLPAASAGVFHRGLYINPGCRVSGARILIGIRVFRAPAPAVRR